MDAKRLIAKVKKGEKPIKTAFLKLGLWNCNSMSDNKNKGKSKFDFVSEFLSDGFSLLALTELAHDNSKIVNIFEKHEQERVVEALGSGCPFALSFVRQSIHLRVQPNVCT